MANIQDIGSGIAYDYGIDPQGKMYIWDKWANKMTFYGDPKAGADQLVTLKLGHDATLNFQGNKAPAANTAAAATPPPVNNNNNNNNNSNSAPAPKALDTAGLTSLDSLIGNYGTIRDNKRTQNQLTHDAHINEKKTEKTNETTKYNGKKLTTLQDFSGAKTDTDINTRNTLENLISSLSTMGLGGSRALTRQVLDAANMSNRKANATQATNNQGLDTAMNEYNAGNENDVNKINDQLGFDNGEADRLYNTNKQTALYKKADIYGASDQAAPRQALMSEGDNLNSMIASSAFMNPSYNGTTKAMATPDLGSYTQDIAKYDTGAIGAPVAMPGGLTPTDGSAAPGNLAVRAIAVNDKNLGVKKKTEGTDLGYGA